MSQRSGRWFTRVLLTLMLATMAAAAMSFHRRPADHYPHRGPGHDLVSTLQTFRSQVELYKIQHNDTPPHPQSFWQLMLHASNTTGQATSGGTSEAYPLGPYMQAAAVNGFNRQSAVSANPAPSVGWIYQVKGGLYTIQAVNAGGDGVLDY